MIKGTITFKFIGVNTEEIEMLSAPLLSKNFKLKKVPNSTIHEFSLIRYCENIKMVIYCIDTDMAELCHEAYLPKYNEAIVKILIDHLLYPLGKMIEEENLVNNPRLFRFSVDYECDKYSAEIKLESDSKNVIKRHKPVLENDTIKFIVSE